MKRVLLALALLPVALVAQEKPEAPKPKVAARVLTALNAATAFADAGYTASKTHRKDFVENDSLAKPLVHHTPLAMTVVAGEVIGLNWLASRMRRSDRWRRVCGCRKALQSPRMRMHWGPQSAISPTLVTR